MIYKKTSPLSVKNFWLYWLKFWLTLDTYGHLAVRVLWSATPIVRRDILLYGLVTLTSVAERLSIVLQLPVRMT